MFDWISVILSPRGISRIVSQTISINFSAIRPSEATKSLTFATVPGFRVTSFTKVLHPVQSYHVHVFLKIFKDTRTRWKFIYTNHFHYFTYSVAVFPSLKQHLIFALCSLTKKNTTYVQYSYELTNWDRNFIWLMPGYHTINYLVYATKQTCVAASVAEIHERLRRLVLHKPYNLILHFHSKQYYVKRKKFQTLFPSIIIPICISFLPLFMGSNHMWLQPKKTVRLSNGECIFIKELSFILFSAKSQVHCLFLSEFSTSCDLVLLLSFYSIFTFP